MAGETTSSAEIKTGAGRFPLVHKLIQFADIRRHYKDMREALIASNRQAGSYKGWVTRWKKKYEASELAQKKLEIEIAQHLADKQELADQIREISQKFQGMGTTLAKLEAFEAAVDSYCLKPAWIALFLDPAAGAVRLALGDTELRLAVFDYDSINKFHNIALK